MTTIAQERETEEAAVRGRAREVDELGEFALEIRRPRPSPYTRGASTGAASCRVSSGSTTSLRNSST